jgi:phosphate-selective porin OprO/OprP
MRHTPAFLCLAALATGAGASPTVDVGGRINVDAAVYDEDVAELGSGSEFRRARLSVEGDLAEDWKYKAEYDFADNDLSMKDVYVDYTGLEGFTVRVGQAKQPFSLEELTSARFITFIERGLPNAFATSRRIGVQLEHAADAYTFAAAIYGQEANEDAGDEGLGAGARIAFAPVNEPGRLLHLGLAAALEEPETTDAGTDSVRFRQTPESHVTSTRLVDTGDIGGVSQLMKLGLEAAATLGPLSLQAEYMTVGVDADAGDFDFDGWYAYASWFPGGETRPYGKGRFERVEATRAWELALRVSSIDLNDGAIAGGRQDDLTLAVNYYFNPYIRVMFNYVAVDAEPGPGLSDEPNVFQVRLSLDF